MAINTFSDILDLWPDDAVASRAIGVEYATLYKWRIRNSIPPKYWSDIVRLRGDSVSYEKLASMFSDRGSVA